MRRYLIYSISAATLLLLPLIAVAASDGFLKPGSYDAAVVIANPEDSPLAEALLRLGVSVYKSRPYVNSTVFTFKIRQDPDFTVFIYYPNDSTYVGRFMFKKGDDESPVEAQFIKEFVPWLQRNAWPRLKAGTR